MQSLSAPHFPEASKNIISYWQLGQPITGGRWYNLYRAAPKSVDASWGHGYVIKLINPELDESNRSFAIDRLCREVMATEHLVHPNVIRLLDSELDRAPFFLVQPWIEGRSLDQFLATASEMSLSRMLWASRQVAEGLRAAHDTRQVHLGLDPSHVILGKTGRVTLLGWSQSHAVGKKVWMPHDQLQLARFTAPECFEPDYVARRASDIYSLGALIYFALARQVPFAGASMQETIRLHRHHIPADLQFVQRRCPPALSTLVKEMLIKNPDSRPSLREVLNRLISIEIEHLTDLTMIPL